MTATEVELLMSAARSFNEVDPQDKVQPSSAQAVSDKTKPGEDFDARASWHQVLEPHGWQALRTIGDKTYWRRPGKMEGGISATTGHCGTKLWVFSSNAQPFEADRAYNKFSAYGLLNCGGDFTIAARELRSKGYGSPVPINRPSEARWAQLADGLDRISKPMPPAPPMPSDEYAPEVSQQEKRITAAQLESGMDDDPIYAFAPGVFERVLAMRSDRVEWVAICDLLRRRKKKSAFDKAAKDHDRQQRQAETRAGWKALLAYRENKDGSSTLEKSLGNCVEILLNDDAWRGCLALDDFANKITPRTDTPFKRRGDTLWKDSDILETKMWLERNYAIRPSTQDVADAITIVAERQVFNPLTDYLDSLPAPNHDSDSLIDTWLTDLVGAPDTPLTRAIGAKWLIAAVARAYDPGCKVDNMLVLEGKQGMKKSRIFEQLCPVDEWFVDGLADPGTKEQAEQIQGKWIVEMAELRGIGKDIDAVKAFITRRKETYRPAYGRTPVVRGRTCVFGGTVNPGSNGYLRDETGNRRFWPIRCTRIAAEITPEIRDRLWAEARERYRAGEHWWLEDPEMIEAASHEALDRVHVDAWQETIERELVGERETSVNAMLDRLKVETNKRGGQEAQRVGRILQMIGWERFRASRSGIRVWLYRAPLSQLQLAS